MTAIRTDTLPAGALLTRYFEKGAYVDCFVAETDVSASHPEYVVAFYTTWLFKIERAILLAFLSRPSTDIEAERLAVGKLHAFAAWSVEARAPNQLLMCDVYGRTRSWFMIVPPDAQHPKTRLYFGSAVVPTRNPETGEWSLGFWFKALLGFHKAYSVALLHTARARLESSHRA